MLQHRVRSLVALSLLVVVGLAGCGAGTADAGAGSNSVTQSLAQIGGVRIVVQVTCAASQDCASSGAMAREASALGARATHGLGVKGATATPTTGGAIEVDLPGFQDKQVATQALTAQGVIQFLDTGEQSYSVGATIAPNTFHVIATGSNVIASSVSAALAPQSNSPYVAFAFDSATAPRFGLYTSGHIGQYLTITQDGVVVESATIQSAITGNVEISGFNTLSDAKALAADLKSTPLPLPATLVSADLVQASGE